MQDEASEPLCCAYCFLSHDTVDETNCVLIVRDSGELWGEPLVRDSIGPCSGYGNQFRSRKRSISCSTFRLFAWTPMLIAQRSVVVCLIAPWYHKIYESEACVYSHNLCMYFREQRARVVYNARNMLHDERATPEVIHLYAELMLINAHSPYKQHR